MRIQIPSRTYLFGLVLFRIATFTCYCDTDSIFQVIKYGTSRLLFGEIWSYGQYCGDRHTPSELVQEDINADKFYENGEFLLHANSTINIDQLIYHGIRARYLTSLTCAINSWGYRDDETSAEADSPNKDDWKCLLYIDTLRSFILDKSLAIEGSGRLLQRLNSYGRVPSGLIHHSHQWYGDYSECVADEGSRYCFGAYRNELWPNDTDSNKMFIRVGMCLPESCNQNLNYRSEYLEKLDEIVKSNLISGQGLTDVRKYHLTELYCPPSLNSQYMKLFKDVTSIFLGLVGGIWLITIMYASLLSRKMDLGHLRDFDLKLILSKFMESNKTDIRLSGLNFFKVVCFFWILWSHYIMLAMNYVFDLHDIRRVWNPSFFGTFLYQAQHAVPLFFIITGILVGFKHVTNDYETIRYRSFAWQRYLRLAPLYLVVYVYVRKFGYLLGSGPMWDYGVSPQSEASQCHQESWLVPLLMLANFIHPFSHCILTGWHIANDFQVFLILPLFIWIYRRSRRLGNWIAVASFLSSHLFHFYNFHTSQNYSFELIVKEPYLFGSRYIMDRLVIDYVNPLGRFGTIILGLLLGSLLKTNEFYSKYSTPKKRAILIVLGLIVEVMSIMARFEMALGKFMFGSYMRSIAYPFTRLTVEIGWFLLILGTLLSNHLPHKLIDTSNPQSGQTYLGTGGLSDVMKLNDEESNGIHRWRGWDVLVKLNYSLMLIHFPVFKHLLQSSQSQLVHFSLLSLFQHGSFVILMSYLASFLLHIVVEVPLTSLIKRLNGR